MKRIEIYIGLSVFALSAKSQVKESRPNVIYIIMDDLGYGDIGCYGSEKIETPNIDRLYKDGISFTQHYTGSPVSAPARCVLMTGMHSGHAQIRANDEMAYRGAIMNYDSMYVHPGLEGQYPLKAYTMTLGRMMQQAGYVTGCFGKWGLGAPGTEGTPNKQGFDSFYGYNCQRQAHSYYPPFCIRMKTGYTWPMKCSILTRPSWMQEPTPVMKPPMPSSRRKSMPMILFSMN